MLSVLLKSQAHAQQIPNLKISVWLREFSQTLVTAKSSLFVLLMVLVTSTPLMTINVTTFMCLILSAVTITSAVTQEIAIASQQIVKDRAKMFCSDIQDSVDKPVQCVEKTRNRFPSAVNMGSMLILKLFQLNAK